MSPRKIPSWPLFLAALLYFLVTAALLKQVPLLKAPDEAAHAEYVEHIAATQTLPVFKGAVPPAPGYEFHQPPLYYALCAPIWAKLPAGAQNYACRVVSLLCGLWTLILVWQAARRLFSNSARVAGGAVFLAALSPLHQGVNASCNNDSLGGLVCAALFYLLVRAWTETVSWRLLVALGFVAGMGFWTKNTCLVVAAATFLGLLSALKKEGSIRAAFGAAGLALALAAPLLVRNQMLYGDPFGLRVFSQAATAGTPGFAVYWQVMDFGTYARGMAWQILLTAWGFYGGPNNALEHTKSFAANGPRLPDAFLDLPLLISAVLPFLAFLGLRRLEWSQTQKSVAQVWLLGIVLVGLAWMQFAFAHISGGQARYLHPAFLPLCVLAAAGWHGLWRGRTFWVASGMAGALMMSLTFLNLLRWQTLV